MIKKRLQDHNEMKDNFHNVQSTALLDSVHALLGQIRPLQHKR